MFDTTVATSGLFHGIHTLWLGTLPPCWPLVRSTATLACNAEYHVRRRAVVNRSPFTSSFVVKGNAVLTRRTFRTPNSPQDAGFLIAAFCEAVPLSPDKLCARVAQLYISVRNRITDIVGYRSPRSHLELLACTCVHSSCGRSHVWSTVNSSERTVSRVRRSRWFGEERTVYVNSVHRVFLSYTGNMDLLSVTSSNQLYRTNHYCL